MTGDGGAFLLIMPDYSDFPSLFMRNLESIGYDASLITDKLPKFEYKGSQKIKNFFRKTFLKDKSFKKELVRVFREKQFLKIADNLKKDFDYILVIRPDLFPISFIESLKNKTSKLIAYQWDGIDKFPSIKDYFSLFDTFFCFEDVVGISNIKKTTNFYFDYESVDKKLSHETKKPIIFYFVGLDWENRRQKINDFVEFADKSNYKLDFYLQEFEKNNDPNEKIKYIKNRISFAENLNFVKKSDVLVDFVDPRHTGLSIRFFEGIYYHKKVITDNKEVKKYDFYNPDNIFVLEHDNYDLIPKFIAKPYCELPTEIVKYYGFSEWIQRIIS